MPSIVSSLFTVDNPQIDGRRVVIETHTDDSGNQYQISYVADVGYDINQRLANDATELIAQLQAEAQQQGS